MSARRAIARRAAQQREWQQSQARVLMSLGIELRYNAARGKGHRMIVKPFADGSLGVEGQAYAVAGLLPGEPIFVLRARDAHALPFLSLYAAGITQGDLFDAERSAKLRADIAAFAQWRRQNAADVRDPD